MSRSVIIVGAGPAGLTAARVLREAGITDTLVLDRDVEPGGLPKYCGHFGFGLLDLFRPSTGPAYAQRLCERAAGVEIATGVTALAFEPGGLLVSGKHGLERISARAVLLATGTREKPRSARLVSGTRPWGVTTTGAFQEMVYKGGIRPFERPVIVGSELVSFSAFLTARHARIRPVAMIEEEARITAPRPCDVLARLVFGTPVLTRARLDGIHGADRVEAVTVVHDGRRREIICDGVIFTGQFVPEATLARSSHIEIDAATAGPVIDNLWRCSDPAFFACGNVLRPVEHSAWASREGALAALAILRSLEGRLPSGENTVVVRPGGLLKYIYPQRLVRGEPGAVRLYGRARRQCRGQLLLLADGRVVAMRRLNALPERRLTIDVPSGVLTDASQLDAVLEANP